MRRHKSRCLPRTAQIVSNSWGTLPLNELTPSVVEHLNRWPISAKVHWSALSDNFFVVGKKRRDSPGMNENNGVL